AEDTWALNEQRLTLLRRNGISSDGVVSLHSAAERHLELAREALVAKDWGKAQGEGQAAWSLSGRVYPSVLSTANDVVYGLVVMLLFAIPFAAICERLFVSGNTIIKKVAGFAAFFTVTFLFFYCFHPAFALATTPMIIFLAFVIIMMSSFVMVIVYNRFEGEMEQIRMAGMGMHKVDVSRLGTLFATIQLGISNMRRRPLRTFLTGITVVLMTFILLTFASFSPSVGFQRIGLDEAPPYNGVFMRQSAWAQIHEPTMARLERQWGAVATLTPMRWMPPTRMPKYPITGPRGVMAVSGVLGVLPDDPSGVELALRRGGADAARGFGGEQDWIFLSDEVLSRIGIAPGEFLSFQGVRLRAGTIDVQKLGSVVQIGGEQITPLAPDPDIAKKADENERLNAAASDGAPDVASTSSVHLSPSACAVVHERVAKRLGAGLHGISMVPRERTQPVPDLAEDIARQVGATLRVGDGGESWLLTSVGKLSVAGLTAVLIPLILGGLIIFSTMLNSVAERGKEIFIYASLGLAPIHVAALFLVEAGIYAVLGGLGGYMLAQLVVSGLGLAASFGYGVPPDLNYSSFTAVATILLVMFTVLLSAFYPALIASRAANPGTTDFRIPDAEGDHLEIAFPFTVSSRDVRGLLAFLTRYFEMRTEASTGCFTAADARMEINDDRLGVAAKVWLAPFDLGISQNLLLEALPTDVRAIFAVRLRLDLLSGQRAAWRRTNIAFLKDLRQQFLVWRTLSPEAMDRYRADGGDEAARQRLASAGDGATVGGAPA
ncbi:MAG: ABC transporter permease, partial [Planctomycetes bacterium]|nr:ABC transporter permease [Planctomycetota bacterium]